MELGGTDCTNMRWGKGLLLRTWGRTKQKVPCEVALSDEAKAMCRNVSVKRVAAGHGGKATCRYLPCLAILPLPYVTLPCLTSRPPCLAAFVLHPSKSSRKGKPGLWNGYMAGRSVRHLAPYAMVPITTFSQEQAALP